MSLLIGAAIGGGISALTALNKQKEQKKLIKQQRKLLVDNFNNDISAMRQQFELNKTNAFYDKFSNELESEQATANTTVNAAASGFGGISLDEVFTNIEFQKDFKERIQDRNIELAAINLDTQSFNTFSQLQANIKTLESQEISNLDILTGTISGALSGATAARGFGK